MTALAAEAPVTRKSGFSPLELFSILGAAVRAANAVESHRQPAREDLRILGIRGELPKAL